MKETLSADNSKHTADFELDADDRRLAKQVGALRRREAQGRQRSFAWHRSHDPAAARAENGKAALKLGFFRGEEGTSAASAASSSGAPRHVLVNRTEASAYDGAPTSDSHNRARRLRTRKID